MKRKLLEEIGDTGRKTTNKSKENRKKLENTKTPIYYTRVRLILLKCRHCCPL
jgi:hypothetical protein